MYHRNTNLVPLEGQRERERAINVSFVWSINSRKKKHVRKYNVDRIRIKHRHNQVRIVMHHHIMYSISPTISIDMLFVGLFYFFS